VFKESCYVSFTELTEIILCPSTLTFIFAACDHFFIPFYTTKEMFYFISCMCVSVHMYICTYVCKHACIYMCVCVCVCVGVGVKKSDFVPFL